MEKFSLDESLRIYIPGIFLSLLLLFILYPDLKSFELILLPAIFIGFIFHAVFGRLHKKLFNKCESRPRFKKENFIQTLKDIVIAKLDIRGISLEELIIGDENNEKNTEKRVIEFLRFMETTFMSKKYNYSELTNFRYPKSLGIMYYNLAVVCLISILVSVSKMVYNYDIEALQLFTILFLSLIAILFFISSKRFFNDSLNRELSYWRSLNKSEVDEIVEIIQLWKRLNN